jgi:hypothetical protein
MQFAKCFINPVQIQLSMNRFVANRADLACVASDSGISESAAYACSSSK